ncbi:MAG: carbohydrate ABC transporter permease, partial [Rhizobiaceae bacterium]
MTMETNARKFVSPIVATLYILFLLAPIYWLVNMSFK